ncbi:MAG TPA: hypothetical protein VKC60_10740 [Opitutaceae bacterium]|nr:hypothetical protein [Opitutaceae bacterium]
MTFTRLATWGWALFLLISPTHADTAAAETDSRIDQIAVDPATTSIYLGSVALKPALFVKGETTYDSTYQVKVIPFLFYNETGRVSINLPPETLTKILEGSPCEFTGHAINDANKERIITGKAYPNPQDHLTGKIKVRIRVSRNVELIFNTIYHFTAKAG